MKAVVANLMQLSLMIIHSGRNSIKAADYWGSRDFSLLVKVLCRKCTKVGSAAIFTWYDDWVVFQENNFRPPVEFDFSQTMYWLFIEFTVSSLRKFFGFCWRDEMTRSQNIYFRLCDTPTSKRCGVYDWAFGGPPAPGWGAGRAGLSVLNLSVLTELGKHFY